MDKVKWSLVAVQIATVWAGTAMAFNWSTVVTDTHTAGWIFLGFSLLYSGMLIVTQAISEARGKASAQQAASLPASNASPVVTFPEA